MDDQQNPCLTAPEILAYLDGELPEGRKLEVDQHLDDCRLCGAAVEGVAGLEWREGFLRSTDKVLARVRARTAAAATAASVARRSAPRFRPAPQYLALAATLVLGVGAAVYLTRPAPGETLFHQYFEPYPSTRPVVRGDSTDGSSGALALYEARDYQGALAALEDWRKREPNDPAVLFYAGLSRLALGQAREATLDLEQVLRLQQNDLQPPAEWYLALAHLHSHDAEPARSRLKRIAEGAGFYRDKARELLSELDRLDGGG
jgi:tetratricopeptide (TPR) repeat protein